MPLPWTKGRVALILEALRGRSARFAIAMLAAVCMVLLNFLTPQIIRFAVDYVITEQTLVEVDGEIFAVDEEGNLQNPYEPPAFLKSWLEESGGRAYLLANIWLLGLAVVLVSLFAGISNYARRFYTLEASEYMAKRLRDTLFAHIQTLPYEWHVKSQTGDIIQRSTSDVDTIRNFISNQFVEMFRIAFQLVTAAALMLFMDVTMALFSFMLIPIIFLFSMLYFRMIGKQFKEADEAEGALQAAAQENYTGVRVVRAFGREQYEVERFQEKNERYTNLWIRTINYLAFYWSFGDVMAGLQMIIVVTAGIFRCASGDISVGTFIAFSNYAGMMIWPVRALGRMLSELSKANVSAGRVREILAAEPERDAPDALCPEIRGRVAFEHVTFAYGEEAPVLRDISFTLEPGKTLAILGGTGSGKSTMMHLLCRLYDVPEGKGRITIDGVDIRLISREHIRRHVGMVLQEPFLYSKTLYQNITAPRPEAPAEDIHEAARVAQVHDTIEGFGEGYETIVGERGVTLSGGQKQRVAIARTVLTDAPVMIFDDSLSAVDTETDARIRAALRERKRTGSAIIISHRISTLMQADTILVLRDGAVEEMGSHEELLRSGGSYRRIFDMQGDLEEEMKAVQS